MISSIYNDRGKSPIIHQKNNPVISNPNDVSLTKSPRINKMKNASPPSRDKPSNIQT